MSDPAFGIVTGAEHVDLRWLHDRLATDTYWAESRTFERVRATVEHSRCYSVFDETGSQVAFARLVTDTATFAWLADVYVDRSVRGRGLAKRLVGRVVDDCRDMGLRRVLLATADAAPLYARFGFASIETDPYDWMSLTWPDHPA